MTSGHPPAKKLTGLFALLGVGAVVLALVLFFAIRSATHTTAGTAPSPPLTASSVASPPVHSARPPTAPLEPTHNPDGR